MYKSKPESEWMQIVEDRQKPDSDIWAARGIKNENMTI